MQAALVILAVAWTLRAHAFEELPAIEVDEASGITLDESGKEFPFVPDHVVAEGLTVQNTQFMSTVMMFLERMSNEMSLLKEQAGKDREIIANLSSSVQVLTQKVASLDEEVVVIEELVVEYRNINNRLLMLEYAVKIANEDRVQGSGDLGSELDPIFPTEDPKVDGEPLYETITEGESREGSREGIGEKTREGSGEHIGEESADGSEHDGEPTLRIEDFPEELRKWICITGECGDDISEESQEGSGEDGEKPILEFDAITRGSSLITSLVITKNRKIVMVDFAQKKVRVASLDAPTKVGAGLSLDQTPWSLALLDDGLVAVSTEDKHVMYIVNISTPEPTLVSRVRTKRAYRGIAPGPGDMLVVSSPKDPQNSSPATVDVISRDGHVTWSVSDRRMDKPFFVTSFRDEFYVSDWGSHTVYILTLHSGSVKTMFNTLDLSHLEMYQPRVVAFDEAGNMYVASGGRVCAESYDDDGWCVLVITRTGHWKNLINFNGSYDTKWPYGISLTPTGILVSWGSWRNGGWQSELTAYSLPSSIKQQIGQLRGGHY